MCVFPVAVCTYAHEFFVCPFKYLWIFYNFPLNINHLYKCLYIHLHMRAHSTLFQVYSNYIQIYHSLFNKFTFLWNKNHIFNFNIFKYSAKSTGKISQWFLKCILFISNEKNLTKGKYFFFHVNMRKLMRHLRFTVSEFFSFFVFFQFFSPRFYIFYCILPSICNIFSTLI